MDILMLSESNYPLDIRIRQEAELLTAHGHNVSVIAIKENKQPYHEVINQVKVYRVPQIEIFKSGKQKGAAKLSFFHKMLTLIKAVTGYGFEYAYFTTACFFISFILMFFYRFDVIHTHNPPDTLFVVAVFYKVFFSKKFVYDHHDLSPDLFLEKYSNNGKVIYRILLWLEKMSCRSADIVIATNESYKQVEIERDSVSPEKIFIVRNGPDLTKMKIAEPVKSIREKNKAILCYLGAINNQDGVQYLIDILAKIVYKYNYNDVILLIIGDGDYLNIIKNLAKELIVDEYIIFAGFVADRNELNKYLSTADIFVDAAPNSFLNDKSTFIKHMEYMVFKKPVVSFELTESMFSLGNAGVFVEANDMDKYAKVIINLINDKDIRKKLGENGGKRVKELSWDRVSLPLIKAYESTKLSKIKA